MKQRNNAVHKTNPHVQESSFSVLYDYQIFGIQRFGGISRYFCEIIRRLNSRWDIGIWFSINYYLTTWHLGKHLIPIPRFILKHYKKYCEQKNRELTIRLLQEKKNYIFHPTYYNSYFLKYIGNYPYVITVHDMIHEIFPEFCSDSDIMIQEKKETITRATRIIAISENTKRDIIRLLHIDADKIDVIYHGTSMRPFSGKQRLKLPERFLLYVGDRTPYKNFDRFIKAFSILQKNDPDLYVVCTGHSIKRPEKEALSRLGVLDRIAHIKASDQALSELYSRALLFVYPSLYEGFGIPILEAYACHCPLALSNTSCFPEIAGEAGCYFNPYSEESIAQAVKSVLYDPQKREALIKAGSERLQMYSWEKTAQKTEAVYRKAYQASQKECTFKE